MTKSMPCSAFDVLSAASRAANLHNLGTPTLYEEAIRRKEARIAESGALVVETGRHTGRSPKDKFIVRDAATEANVWWDNNAAMSREMFDRLKDDILDHVSRQPVFYQDLRGGAAPSCTISVRVFTELAWHALFIRNMLIRPEEDALAGFEPDLTILCAPNFRADPKRHGTIGETVIACDLTNSIVLIGGTFYAGEMKKSVFTMLNYTLLEAGVLPMHCSANLGDDGCSALFFGLSGTGKTTLSASADRSLIGDDEHGWGRDGIFNIEGGCYAKAIRLDAGSEPAIFAAARQFGTVLENVAVDGATRQIDFNDAGKTENTRAAYPLEFVVNASRTGMASHPKHIVMLTADAFGVMPPIARLTAEQAIYYYLSGFTAKVAGTERGVTEPQPTFSTCFGAPFLPRHPSEYAKLLHNLIDTHRPTCWLINTGWTGGPFGVGRRMPLVWTRALLTAALQGSLATGEFRKDRHFGLAIPVRVAGVPSEALDPIGTWADPDAFDQQARTLVALFAENFARFSSEFLVQVSMGGPGASPSAKAAANHA